MPSKPVIPIVPAETRSDQAVPEVRYESMYQKRALIYARSVTGWFANWRWVMVWVTQAFFYGMPWLQWNGRQALLFDLGEQRFYVLGLVFYPQDFIFLAALLVLSALLLFFFTAIAGRLWCGYTCPQTVYTEIFLWLERRIEGDRQARMKLDQSSWSARKLGLKSAKQAAWLSVALVTGFSFVGYFTPIRTLAVDLLAWQVSGWNLFWILFYAGATYGNAGYLREQMCKYICPYARFQSALIDKDSLIISYDAARGEPRGARSRKQAQSQQADCIDCTLCVQVCPTGIDIRNGLQNECIACAACIDVCDSVMEKVGSPKGLIRYSTENGMRQGWTRRQMFARVLRPRVLIYGAALALGSAAFAASVALRSPFLVDVIRDRGTLARMVEQGEIENVYRVQVMNRTEREQRYQILAHGPVPLAVLAPEVKVEPAGIRAVTVSLRMAPTDALKYPHQSVPISFEVKAMDQSTGLSEKSTFFVPD